VVKALRTHIVATYYSTTWPTSYY